MKYLKTYNESKSPLNSLSDEDLEERLKWLSIEYKDIGDEMLTIRTLLTERKEERQREYAKDLPVSIYDFDKEQLEWIFEHHHGTTTEHYNIARKYLNQLRGVTTTGFNETTKQFYFSINCSSLINVAENDFEYDSEIGRSINFLGKNLKRNDGFVEFGILYTYDQSYGDKLLYIESNDIRYKQGYGTPSMRSGRSYGSVEIVLQKVVENDLSEKNNEF